MDSPLSVVSPFKTSVASKPTNCKSDYSVQRVIEIASNEAWVGNQEGFTGVLEVYIQQARDIHNICIYQKQDVYAKLCLTSDPDTSVSTKIINGGGRNPVFNENLRLNVKTVDCSLKCEIFMMSRVKNYLEDQLLGFALVPLSEVLLENGALEKEFSLSSTDLFHSPAGFVQLSLLYKGTSPEVMAIPAISSALASQMTLKDSESVPSDFDKIEFPDPHIAKENQMMVSEYFGLPCASMDTETSESLVSSDTENQHSSKKRVHVVESFSAATADSVQAPKRDSPPSSESTNGVSSPSLAASSESSDAPEALKIPNQEQESVQKEKKDLDAKDGEGDSSSKSPSEKIAKPIINVNIEPEQTVVQQDIIDKYMKSMQHFTESLSKMNLPLDFDSGPTSSGSSSSDQKTNATKNSGSRVFYGSRAFF